MAGKITAKQIRFVEEYLCDLNATQAATRAGYSPKTAYAIGVENLRKPQIAAIIAERQSARTQRTEITQDYVLGKLRENLERSMRAEPVLDKKGNPTGEYVYQGAVANRAAELLGKHLGMFTDRVHVTTNPEDAANELASLLGVPATVLHAMQLRPQS